MSAASNQKLALGLVLLGLLLFTHEALAAVGRIYYASGGVYIERGPDRIPAEADVLLEEGDVIVTESDGRVQWRLSDDSFFVLRPNARFRIESHVFQEAGAGGGKGVYELLSDGVRTLTGIIASRNSAEYQMKTPVATLGIRGTDYTLIFLDAAFAASLGVPPGLYIRVDTGAVVLTNSAGSFEVKAGQIAFVSADNVLPRIIPDAPAVFVNWAFDFELRFPGLEDAIERLPRIEPFSPS